MWDDQWLPAQTGHKLWSPKPLGCEIFHVVQLMDRAAAGWDEYLVRSNFLPFKASQILKIPMLNLQEKDSLVWSATGDGFLLSNLPTVA